MIRNYSVPLRRIIKQLAVSALLLATCSLEVSAQKGEELYPRSNNGKAGAAYPEFSWDRLPLYMHIRKATSYTDEEIAFLARFPLITFEKANGYKDYGSVEKGTLTAARAVKKVNPNTKILYYRNVIVDYDNYDANKELNAISGALLKNTKGTPDSSVIA